MDGYLIELKNKIGEAQNLKNFMEQTINFIKTNNDTTTNYILCNDVHIFITIVYYYILDNLQ